MPEAEIADTGEGGASGIFSIRTIGAFFAGFGWAGAAMLQAGYSTGAATFLLQPYPVLHFLELSFTS